MTRPCSSFLSAPLTLLALVQLVMGALCLPAYAQRQVAPSNTSWTDPITAPIKQGFSKLGQTLNPKPLHPTSGPEDEAISLKSKAKPGPELYVSVAALYEQAGKLDEAEPQYQLALKDKPNDLPALLGYAQLQERRGRPDDAVQLYQRAAKAHPQEATTYNNLGMCHARRNRLDDATAAMSRAVQLSPQNPLYRNNIATVLVDQGKLREAFIHLQAVHGVAAAYYNLGYLLNKKGQKQEALQQFTLALKADPSMVAAQRWIEHLQRPAAQARLSPHPAAAGVKLVGRPASQPLEEAPVPPNESVPQRLPTTAAPEQSAPAGPGLPGISYESSAPLPPPLTTPALRPLPKVN